MTEAKVDGYTTEVGELTAVKDEAGKVTGYKVEVTNTHTPETTSITVSGRIRLPFSSEQTENSLRK